MSRYIIIPEPAKFIDPVSKKPAIILNAEGEEKPLVERDHEWFMHVYMLSHLQFSQDAGGVEASRAAREIARSLERAVTAGETYYEVSDDSLRRLKCCMARANEEDYKESLKEKPDPRVLAKSTLGMTRPMDNFTAMCFMDHFDAIENASTTKPEVPEPEVPVAVVAAPAVDEGTPTPVN